MKNATLSFAKNTHRLRGHIDCGNTWSEDTHRIRIKIINLSTEVQIVLFIALSEDGTIKSKQTSSSLSIIVIYFVQKTVHADTIMFVPISKSHA